MSAVPRPHRKACPGEIVNWFESGDPTEVPVPATVHSEFGGNCLITYQKPGHPTVQTRTGAKHIHDQYWDSVSLTSKRTSGAFDFHPVYKGVFDKWLAMAHAQEVTRQQREAEKTDLSDEEFNALNALERFGDDMPAITKDTGLTRERLKKLPKFMEAFNAIKTAKWDEKNAITATPAPAE